MADHDSGPVRRVRDHLANDPPPEHFYASLLGLRSYGALELRERVEEGLSYAALERVRETLGLPTTRFADLIRIPPRTLARRKETKRLEPDESDRLLRLARVVGLTLQLFEGDLPEARRWLSTPHAALAGEAPLDVATSDVGAREVEHLIGRLEHGIPL